MSKFVIRYVPADGLAPVWCQAISSANDDQVYVMYMYGPYIWMVISYHFAQSIEIH